MRIKYNLLFIPILIICAVAVWYLGFHEEKQQEARRLADRALVDIDKLDIVEIIRPDATIRLEKSGTSTEGAGTAADWNIVDPYRAGCDPVALAALLDGIFQARSERDIEDVTTEQMSEYGLAEPEMELKLASVSGGILMDLLVGRTNPSGSSRYAAFSGNTSTAFLVPIYDLEPLDVTPDEIRDARALAFNNDDIVSIQLSSAVAEFTLQRNESAWHVSGPESFPASPARVEQLMHDLAELTAKEFLQADSVNPELRRTSVSVEINSSDGTLGELELHGEDIVRGIFATSSRQPSPFIVEAYIYDRLALDPDVFFHVMLIDASAEQIQRVYIRQPGAENLEIQRTGQGPEDWRLLKPEGRLYTDPGDFENFTTALMSLQPEESVPLPERPEDYGLEPVYFMKIEVYGADNSEISALYIGSADDKGNYYATQDGYTYFTINSGLIDVFIAASDKLKGTPG